MREIYQCALVRLSQLSFLLNHFSLSLFTISLSLPFLPMCPNGRSSPFLIFLPSLSLPPSLSPGLSLSMHISISLSLFSLSPSIPFSLSLSSFPLQSLSLSPLQVPVVVLCLSSCGDYLCRSLCRSGNNTACHVAVVAARAPGAAGAFNYISLVVQEKGIKRDCFPNQAWLAQNHRRPQMKKSIRA